MARGTFPGGGPCVGLFAVPALPRATLANFATTHAGRRRSHDTHTPPGREPPVILGGAPTRHHPQGLYRLPKNSASTGIRACVSRWSYQNARIPCAGLAVQRVFILTS